MKKILIAVPSMDTVPAQFAQSLATLNRVESCAVAFQIGSLVYTSRNRLAMIAIQNEYDYILWLDSDMVFNPDTLEVLWQYRDLGDIITGLYFRRVEPYTPVLFSKLDITETEAITEDVTEIPQEPFEVAGCGFGCVLTPTDLYIDIVNKHGNLFAPIKGVGEDLSFCYRARQCGYKIVCVPGVQLGHIGHYTVTKDFYDVYRVKNESKNH